MIALALLALASGLVLATALFAPEPLAAPPRGLELGRVNLFEPGGERRSAVSLRVEGTRIAAIGSPRAVAGDRFVDAILIPGLTDMHAHFPITGLPGEREYTSLLMLRHGVTRVRLLGGVEPASLIAYRDAIEAGRAPGPRYYNCGPFLDGPEPVLPGARVVADPDAARAAVSELAEARVDCVKAYDRLNLATTEALREAAREHGLPIVGHTPQQITLEQARLDDHQHLRGAHPPFQGERLDYPHFLGAWLRNDDARVERVVEISLEHDLAHTPTLVAVDGTLQSRDWASWRVGPVMQLWLPQARDALWSADVGFNPVRFMESADFEMVRAATVQMRRTVKRLYEAGVPIHTGTDANAPNVVPGISLHRELQLLVEAGLDPEQALELSTRRSPRFLGIANAGRLAVGAPADFVLLRLDPTRDVEALGSILAVVQQGRLYSRADLEARMQRYRDHYDGLAFRLGLMPALRGVLAVSTWALD